MAVLASAFALGPPRDARADAASAIERAAGRLAVGDETRARALLHTVGAGDPARAQARLLLAALDLDDGRDDAAVANAREALARDPRLGTPAWRILVTALLRLGHRDLAARAAAAWADRAPTREDAAEARRLHRALRGGPLWMRVETSAGYDTNVRLDPDALGPARGAPQGLVLARAGIDVGRGAEHVSLDVSAAQTTHFGETAAALDSGFVDGRVAVEAAPGDTLRLRAAVGPRLTWSSFVGAPVAEQLFADAGGALRLRGGVEPALEAGAVLQDLHAVQGTGIPGESRDGLIFEVGSAVRTSTETFLVGMRARYGRELLRSVAWRSHAVRVEAWGALRLGPAALRLRSEWLHRELRDVRPGRADDRLAADVELALPFGSVEPFVAASASARFADEAFAYQRVVAVGGVRASWEGP